MSKKEIVPLSLEEARKIFTTENIKKISDKNDWGKIIEKWPFHDQQGDIIGLDIEFEKSYQTFTWNGKEIKYDNPPYLIYNLHEVIKSEKPILVTSNPKSAKSAEILDKFTCCSWSGNSDKPEKAYHWKYFRKLKQDIYIYHSDNEKGFICAGKIRAKLPKAKIIKPVPAARSIKNDADIIEALEVLEPEEFYKYIDIMDNIIEPPKMGSESASCDPALKKESSPALNSDPIKENSELPFKALGIGDDGRAYFLTEAERLYDCALDSLSKGKLRVLANLQWWINDYGDGVRINNYQWDNAIDDIIRFSEIKDFDATQLRGRGAWIDGDKISYHDGKHTYGLYDDRKRYIRLRQIDIGINDSPASNKLCQSIKDIIFELTFETKTDAVRCMGWAALAPFAGALKYRPALLLTGSSGSGKSTVQEYILEPLTNFIWADAKETSVAGMRSRIGLDSAVAFFEEAEKDGDKSKLKIADILSFVRSNFTSKSPDAFKGTKEGGWVSYKMNSMFGIASVNPTIESVADENRIFRINMIKSSGKGWKKTEKKIKNILTEENCRAIRALTWQKLKTIFGLIDRVVDAMQEKTGKDYRSSYSDAMLASAFIIVWNGIDNPSDKQISDMLDKYYEYQPADDPRDEAEEFLEKIFQEIIEILHENNREKLTVIECLNRICMNGKIKDSDNWAGEIEIANYRQTLSRIGIKVEQNFDIAINNNHIWIMRVTGTGPGYSRILKRHPKCMKTNQTIYYYTGEYKKSTILSGLLVKTGEDLGEIPF